MKTKVLTVILIASLTPLFAFSQLKPDLLNWIHKGINEYTKSIKVETKTISGTKVDGWDATKAKVDNAVPASNTLIQIVDSTYQKPGSYTTPYDFKNQVVTPLWVRTYKSLGVPIKAIPVSIEQAIPSANGTMVDAQIWWNLVNIVDSTTVTSICFTLQTAGTSTFDAYNGIGIYSVSGSTLTKITETANSATIWTAAANTPTTINLPAPILLVPGKYYVAFNTNWSTAGTVPVIYYANYGMGLSKEALTNGIKIAGKTTTQASLPASLDVSTITVDNYGYGFYLK